MYRTLFRIGALAAVILGTAAAVIGYPNRLFRTHENVQVADPCLLINEIWYCFDDLNGDQGSTALLAGNW